jgi:hypothetical protein
MLHGDGPPGEEYPDGQIWGETEFDAHELPAGQVEHVVVPHWP